MSSVNRSVLSCSVAMIVLGLCGLARAELAGLTDAEMAEVDGAGIALVLEDFLFSHGEDPANDKFFKIGGIKSSHGEDVEITVGQLYIAREGSNYGENLSPVNLGRLINPYRIDLVDGDTIGVDGKGVIEIAAPRQYEVTKTVHQDRDLDGELDPVRDENGYSVIDPSGNVVLQQFGANDLGYDCITGAAGQGTCASRPSTSEYENGERPDLGLKLQVQVGDQPTDALNLHVKSAVFDGSRLRLWGEDNRLAGELKLNLYSPEVTISACEDGGADCGKELKMHNFLLELALGNVIQPMAIDVTVDHANVANSGHLVFEVKSIRDAVADRFEVTPASLPTHLGWSGGGTYQAASNKEMWDYFDDYYSNPEFRSNLYIGKLEVTDPGGAKDFGSSRIEGLLIQYMNITTHDLAPTP